MNSPFAIQLENFQGPLDLLLHLIRKHEMDIYDIPIAEITAQYQTILDDMQQLNLEVAGEFLVMAATLLQIKSNLLLPQPDPENLDEEEEEDPRAELVKRLLEYQKYKEAALDLDERALLGRDVFSPQSPSMAALPEQEPTFSEVGVFELITALQDLLREVGPAKVHEVAMAPVSIAERINLILTRLVDRESVAFRELFTEQVTSDEIIVTFLSLLELVKMRSLKVMQNSRFGTIWLFPAVPPEALEGLPLEEDDLGYR